MLEDGGWRATCEKDCRRPLWLLGFKGKAVADSH